MVSANQVLTAPTVVAHDAKRLANGDAVGADVGPGPHLICVVALLDIHSGLVAADGTRLFRRRDHDHRGCGGEEGTAHSGHHSPTRAIGIATVVVSTGPRRQLRNLWRNRCKLPSRRRLTVTVLAISW